MDLPSIWKREEHEAHIMWMWWTTFDLVRHQWEHTRKENDDDVAVSHHREKAQCTKHIHLIHPWMRRDRDCCVSYASSTPVGWYEAGTSGTGRKCIHTQQAASFMNSNVNNEWELYIYDIWRLGGEGKDVRSVQFIKDSTANRVSIRSNRLENNTSQLQAILLEM